MDKKINKDIPIHPEISCDGWYAYCPVCGYFDLVPEHKMCPRCEQALDWSWMKNKIAKDK